MIPIFSIWSIIILVGTALNAFKLYKGYKTSSNELVNALYKVTLSLGLLFAFLIPGALIKNAFLAGILSDFSFFFLFLSLAYFLTIPFSVYFHRSPKPLFWGIVFLGFGVLVLNLIDLRPATPYSYRNFFFYMPGSPTKISQISGGFVSFLTIIGSLFYALGSSGLKEKKAKLRAILFSLSTLLLGVGGIVTYAVSPVVGIFWAITISLSVDTIAMVLIMIAILVIKLEEKPKYVKKVY